MPEICEEVIHYPSEDYPCLCERLVLDESGKVCVACEHDARKHRSTNVTPEPLR
jgi:hypothetical protein